MNDHLKKLAEVPISMTPYFVSRKKLIFGVKKNMAANALMKEYKRKRWLI